MQPTGLVVGTIDIAQLVLYAFWIFFAGLILYLRREDKREGYPLISDRSDRIVVRGLPDVPKPKIFRLAHGRTVMAPRPEVAPPVAASPAANFPGAPLQPSGDPMQDGVGPAAYAMREDEPDRTFDEDLPKIVPLRAAPGWALAEEDPDPRGMTVIAGDRKVAGTVSDAWIDRSEVLLRYLEVETSGAAGPRRVLVPMPLVTIDARRRRIGVSCVTAQQLADAPAPREADQITLREEDRISAYFAGGERYATPDRLGPLL